MAFLLVTFLWPRKEKSLAQARRAGETPSRAAPSCPAWRSHAQVTQPLTLTLSRKGRGDGYRGRLRCANRPYVHIAPYASPVGARGSNRKPETLTDYTGRGRRPRILPQARDTGLVSARIATAPGCRYHSALLTISGGEGGQQAHSPSYGAISVFSTQLMSQSPESVGFLRCFKVRWQSGRWAGGEGRRFPPTASRCIGPPQENGREKEGLPTLSVRCDKEPQDGARAARIGAAALGGLSRGSQP